MYLTTTRTPLLARLGTALLVFVAAFAVALPARPLPPAPVEPGPDPAQGPIVGHAVHSDTSPPLRDIPSPRDDGGDREVPIHRPPNLGGPVAPTGPDPVQTSPGAPTALAPSTDQTFEGISNLDNSPSSVFPPDTNGDVGPNH